ncbi:MAG TPA: hypothetical protein VFP84_17155 [Kofleriaceae bacterium]|nr:hypothetical protein [Kofleriaceae bacterium]
MRRLFPVALALALAACGGHPPSPAAPPAPEAAPVTADKDLELAGGANALWWDAASSTLFLTDNNADALLAYTDTGGLAPVVTLPASEHGISLGGIVRHPDGTILVASFGFGKAGTVFRVGADRIASALTGLDPVRRRVGLAQDATGALYTGYFVGGKGETIGGVAKLDVQGASASEIEIAGASTKAGLQKVVGLVATPDAIYVADQGQHTIFKLGVPGFQLAPLATVAKVDLLIQLPGGDLLTGGGSEIARITPAGAVTPVALPNTHFDQVRGLAFDPAGKRLFIIDHSTTPGRPDRLHVRSFPG